MADSTQVLSALDKQRQALVDAYIQRAWTMWKSLDPADWWNDAVTQGVGSWITMNQIAFVKAMRRLGVSYADIWMRENGMAVGDARIPEYIVVRDNTDPWAVSVRPADAYRDIAVRDPSFRPLAWDKLDQSVKTAVDDWLDTAMRRLESNAETDGTIALNSATSERFQGNGVTRYRRVIHPELSRTGVCGLCVVAANNVYSTRDLIPLHNNCKCGVAPIIGDHDPGLDLNRKDLDAIYKAANNSTSAADLKQIRVKVVNHSEIGPILTQKEWRTAEGVSKEWHRPDMDMTRTQMRRMLDRATEFQTRYQQVLDTGKQVDFDFEGRHYAFKPSGHVRQAMSYQTAWLKWLRSSLGLAA